jgi:hypothetical protein
VSATAASPVRLRRVLIVSPHFPPLNAPDMQRARQALPYLRNHGWEPVVLAVAPEHAGSGVLDPALEQTYPADIRIVRVHGIAPGRTRWLGLGSLWWRCGGALRRAGAQLLAAERFDLVFLTTTQFDAFTLGPAWQRRFGVPYVVDYQDPWINSYYHRTNTRPPGGWWKYNFTQWLARRREPAVVRRAAGLVVVSDAYQRDLGAAYPEFDAGRITLLPFGVNPADFALAGRHQPATPLIDFHDGNFHFVYAGRCGPNMSIAMTVLFRAFRRYLASHPADAGRMRFHFIGTDYAPPPIGREWAMPTARDEGVAEFVSEHCYRVPYFDALHYLVHAGALMIVGSNDSTYNASKLFPYVLARRPLLIVFHAGSLVMSLARELGLPAFGFTGEADVPQLVESVYEQWFRQRGFALAPRINEPVLHAHTAEAMTARLAEVFDRATKVPPPHGR